MNDITVETVCETAEKLLSNAQPVRRTAQEFVEISPSFFADADFTQGFKELGLTSLDTVFSFNKGNNLTKNNLAFLRSRTEFQMNQPPATAFLKRYNRPPVFMQIKNWLSHRRKNSFAFFECEPTARLNTIGINTPKVIAYGQQWAGLFEKRSFIITEKIPNAESLERKLPDYIKTSAVAGNLKSKRKFIRELAGFVKKIHQSGFRHRDLYFSHVFYGRDGRFYLIDLARVFKPKVFAERFRIKDIAQIYHSAPGSCFSKTDRLRFYLEYAGTNKLAANDKRLIYKVISKTKQMSKHDLKHSRTAPFES